jgi:hypothetical protein
LLLIVCALPWLDAAEFVEECVEEFELESEPDVDPEVEFVVVMVVLIGLDDELDVDPAFEPDIEPEATLVDCTGLAAALELEPDTAPAFEPDAELLVCAMAGAGAMAPVTSAMVLMAVQSLFMAILLTGACPASCRPDASWKTGVAWIGKSSAGAGRVSDWSRQGGAMGEDWGSPIALPLTGLSGAAK